MSAPVGCLAIISQLGSIDEPQVLELQVLHCINRFIYCRSVLPAGSIQIVPAPMSSLGWPANRLLVYQAHTFHTSCAKPLRYSSEAMLDAECNQQLDIGSSASWQISYAKLMASRLETVQLQSKTWQFLMIHANSCHIFNCSCHFGTLPGSRTYAIQALLLCRILSYEDPHGHVYWKTAPSTFSDLQSNAHVSTDPDFTCILQTQILSKDAQALDSIAPMISKRLMQQTQMLLPGDRPL